MASTGKKENSIFYHPKWPPEAFIHAAGQELETFKPWHFLAAQTLTVHCCPEHFVIQVFFFLLCEHTKNF